MDTLYLDYNGFQRGFDNPEDPRIREEALACHEIFSRAQQNKIKLIWSFMHDDETNLCPFPERKLEVLRLSSLCKIRIGPEEEIYNLALSYQKKESLHSKDALHLACAVYAEANFFLSCDDQLVRQTRRLKLEIQSLNPVDYFGRKSR